MAEGHGRDAWSRAALLCAVLANAHRDPRKGRALTPADFDPYARAQAPVETLGREGLAALKAAFVKG